MQWSANSVDSYGVTKVPLSFYLNCYSKKHPQIAFFTIQTAIPIEHQITPYHSLMMFERTYGPRWSWLPFVIKFRLMGWSLWERV